MIETHSAAVDGIYEADFYAGSPAVTKNSYGKGQAYYIGARLEEQFHRDFYQGLISDLSLEPVLQIAHGPGVSVQVRQDEDANYAFIMNFTEQEQTVSIEAAAKDLMTGEELSGELALAKYEVRILAVK